MPSLDDRAEEIQLRFLSFPEINEEFRGLVDATHQLAQALLMVTKMNREQSIALTHLEEAMLWAMKSILARG